MEKRNFFYAAFVALAFVLGFSSCSNSEDDPIVIDPTVKTTITDLLLKETSEDIGKPDPDFAVREWTVTDDAPVEKVIISKSEKAIVYLSKKAAGAKGTRAAAINENVIVCDYTMEGSNIIIQAGGHTIKVSIIDYASIIIDEIAHATNSDLLPAPTDVNEIALCREWKNAEYTASVYFDKLPIYGAKAEEQTFIKDVRELTKKVKDKLIKDGSNGLKDEGFDMLRNNLVGVNFLNNGTVYFSYQDGKVEESSWKWIDKSKGKLNTTLDGVNVNVDLRFKKGGEGKVNNAFFIIDANLRGVGGLGVHDLNGQLICRMTD